MTWSPQAGPRALVVDDEPLLRAHLAHHLAQLWPELEIAGEARNGREAVDLAASLRPDVVFLDVHMPGMNGVEAARLMGPDVQVVFVTAYEQYAVAAFEQGAIDYLQEEWGKPNAPKPVLGPQRVVAEGDYVLVHYMYSLEGRPTKESHIDIFKFKDRKIIEHWDVKQQVPEHSENQNGMW